MEMKHCPNCMRVLENGAGQWICPNCGFDFTANPQPQNALPWDTLLHDRYLVGRVLGQGGFGITYIGFDTNLQCKVAIKEYYPRGAAVRDASQSCSLTWTSAESSRDKELGCESFLREARKMARIGSIPGIVRVIDTFTENDTSYIIMDYLEGVTLRKYVEINGAMSFERCLDMLRPLCNSIDRMHRQNMVHRDISPDNILLRGDGSVWLLDFGAAKDTAINMNGEASAVVAKKGFSPSEQYSGKNIGPWTDVYALCATLYFCVSGKALPDVSERVQDDSIQWGQAQVSQEVQDAMQKGLSMRYSDRIQSVSELMDRLENDRGPRKDDDRKRNDHTQDGGTGDETELVSDPRRNDSAQGGGTGDKTELVTDPGQDYGYSISIDPIGEKATKQNREALIKKAAAIAAAAVLVIGGAAFAISRIGSGAKDGYVEEKVYTYASGGSGIYTGEWVDGQPNGSGTMMITEEVVLPNGQVLPAGTTYQVNAWKDGLPGGWGTAEFATGAVYEGDWNDGGINGKGTMTYADGGVYDGEWIDGLRSGQGVMTFANGDKYEGEWKDDVQEETYVTDRSFTSSSGVAYVYTGEVSGGQPNGNGTAIASNGDMYSGFWKNGEKEGQGTYTWANGDKYEGEYTDGRMEGQGTYTWANGNSYVGSYKNNDLDGYGVFTWADGTRYEGEFRGSVMEGQGTLTMASGDKYVGEFKNGVRDGQGTYYFSSGQKYVGNFSNGQPSGQGVLYNTDGSVAQSGNWSNGSPTSSNSQSSAPSNPQSKPESKPEPEIQNVKNQSFTFVTSEFSVSGTYTGEWKDGKPNGEGTMTMKEHNNSRWGYGDTLWSANWVNGLIEGYGEWRSSEMGGYYDGNFSKGLKSGYGMMWFDDGTVYDGQWRKGNFIG